MSTKGEKFDHMWMSSKPAVTTGHNRKPQRDSKATGMDGGSLRFSLGNPMFGTTHLKSKRSNDHHSGRLGGDFNLVESMSAGMFGLTKSAVVKKRASANF